MLRAERAAGGVFRRRAEGLGEAHLRVLVERLVAQQNHQVLVPGIEEFLLERVVDRVAQVDAHDFRAERGRKRRTLTVEGFFCRVLAVVSMIFSPGASFLPTVPGCPRTGRSITAARNRSKCESVGHPSAVARCRQTTLPLRVPGNGEYADPPSSAPNRAAWRDWQ